MVRLFPFPETASSSVTTVRTECLLMGPKMDPEMEEIMKRLVTTFALAATMVFGMGSVALAGPGYGKAIQDACGASMGQLIGEAKSSGTAAHPNYAGGAKALAAVAAAHGCG